VIDRVVALLRRAAKPPVAVAQTPADVVHAENKWTLLRYRARREGVSKRTPVLLVPSLINRHYVLDLMPGKSFVEWLVRQGFDVYCIDWGTPDDEDRYVTFDDITDRYIGRALRVACKTAGADKAHMLGYCLGGTLAAIHASVHPERVQSLTLLATPLAFHDEGMLSLWTRAEGFDVAALVDGAGNVPWQVMQATFTMLRPTMHTAKAMTMLDKAWDDEVLDGFFALETWGNDNVSFPGAAYKTYIKELYQEDALIKDRFYLAGRPARLANIKMPTLMVTFEHDAIVPCSNAAMVMDRLGAPDKHRLHLPGGHVGAVVSKKAAKGLWPAIATFWSDRDA
jgi:polyhydroxyalkanoate synthase